ncbi:MAG: GNAT family N-acetyltransferase [Paludibacteraceae bacterium]|nr:GNAT family N-acetyltransferase [Paludibacteraceae bacterium]
MKDLLTPIDRDLIKAELTEDKLLRTTNKAGNLIYLTTASESPNIMKEIARIRELAFRLCGAGSGKMFDMDEFDWKERPYKQLFVWDPQNEEIIGGYRLIFGNDVKLDENGQPELVTASMYKFSPQFIEKYLPCTIELGRSFVHPDYQASKMGSKSLYSLDNLWDGLGAITVLRPDMKYFFGKVTVYPSYDEQARELIFTFLNKYFPDSEALVEPIEPFNRPEFSKEYVNLFEGGNYKEEYKVLNAGVRERGVNIPPLVNTYMGLSPKMRSFGYAVCEELGGLIEFAIMVPIYEMYEEKKARHIETFVDNGFKIK